MELRKELVVVRGGGDIATGTIHKLRRSGFPVLVLETAHPSAIRRCVALSEAVYDGVSRVEDLTCRLAASVQEAVQMLPGAEVPMLVDPGASCLDALRPFALVDAILAKKNMGTRRDMARRTIALGPGFTAGKDVDFVIETMRGHQLGRVIQSGSALPDTGVPGEISGYSRERVIHAPAAGTFYGAAKIGDIVKRGQRIGEIAAPDGQRIPVPASMDGLLRGLIRDGYPVTAGFKTADIDPRESEYKNCFTISDKARCIAGGVLEALLYPEGSEA